MVREKYVPSDNQWVAYEDFDADAFATAVFDEVGATFPLQIRANGHVLLDTAELPNGVSENDAKQAIRDNHPHR